MDITVYSTPTCGYCTMVKEFLSQHGVAYKEKDVSADRNAAREMVDLTGQMGVPVTVIDGETIIGFDRPRLEEAIKKVPPKPKAPPPSFGASVADAGKVAFEQGKDITLGAYVGRVKPGSAADRMALVPGDVITALNGRRIGNAADLEKALAGLDGRSHLTVSYLRGGRSHTAEGGF
jgi:glutaredoxin-like YruB-family protein